MKSQHQQPINNNNTKSLPLNQQKSLSFPFNQADPKAPSQSISFVPRPKPAPGEDILYQWRLARKMEKAKESEKIFSKLPHMAAHGSVIPTDVPDVLGRREAQDENKEITNRHQGNNKQIKIINTKKYIHCLFNERKNL